MPTPSSWAPARPFSSPPPHNRPQVQAIVNHAQWVPRAGFVRVQGPSAHRDPPGTHTAGSPPPFPSASQLTLSPAMTLCGERQVSALWTRKAGQGQADPTQAGPEGKEVVVGLGGVQRCSDGRQCIVAVASLSWHPPRTYSGTSSSPLSFLTGSHRIPFLQYFTLLPQETPPPPPSLSLDTLRLPAQIYSSVTLPITHPAPQSHSLCIYSCILLSLTCPVTPSLPHAHSHSLSLSHTLTFFCLLYFFFILF